LLSNLSIRNNLINTTQEIYAQSPIESRRHTLEQVQETARNAVEDPEFNPYADRNQPASQHRNNGSSSTSSSPTRHINVVIDDTEEARVDISHKILTDDI